MRGGYERLSYVNVCLLEARHELEQLHHELALDDIVVRLMMEQLEEVRRDTNSWLGHELLNREAGEIRARTKNWRLAEMLEAEDRPSAATR